MRSDIVPGAIFPDYELSDHTAKRRKLSDLQGPHPMVLVLSRGGFCPKDRRQAELLVQLHRELEVAYCRLVTISTDNITETNEYRTGVGAHWPFLSDAGRVVQKDLDIAEYTDAAHNPMIPHVIVLEPGLVIYKVYNGYWFFGRPTLEDLRQDLRVVTKKCRPDWDITTPELKAAWQQSRKELFYPYGKTYIQTLGEQDQWQGEIWRRTLPQVRAWPEKYKNQGLVVIGVHAPEFAFEKIVDNVRWAAKDMRVDYPIVTDNERVIQRAFNNEYWPALYFVDAQGHIRHHQFGEGQYEQSETIIQQLLAEAGIGGIGHELIAVDAREAENYVGYERTQSFASPGGAIWSKRQVYAAPKWLGLNQWALSGDWTAKKQAIVLNKANERIAYRFHARDLHLVMGPAARGTSVRFRVLIDGQTPELTWTSKAMAQLLSRRCIS